MRQKKDAFSGRKFVLQSRPLVSPLFRGGFRRNLPPPPPILLHHLDVVIGGGVSSIRLRFRVCSAVWFSQYHTLTRLVVQIGRLRTTFIAGCICECCVSSNGVSCVTLLLYVSMIRLCYSLLVKTIDFAWFRILHRYLKHLNQSVNIEGGDYNFFETVIPFQLLQTYWRFLIIPVLTC